MMRVMVLMAALMLAAGAQQMHGQGGTQPQDQSSSHQTERKQLTQGAQARPPMPGKDITGNWQGTLQLEGDEGLRTIVKITENDGKYKATFYSIDQGGQPIAVTSISLAGATLNFAITPLDLTYTGRLNPDGNTMVGSVTQGGQAHALNLDHVAAENTWAIPEPPKPMPGDADPLVFEVATIKPGTGSTNGTISFSSVELRIANIQLYPLLSVAYGHLQPHQIVGLPEWSKNKVFDIEAKVAASDAARYRKLNFHQQELMLRPLLEDRFHLKAHFETREGSVYALVIAKNGSKLKDADPNEPWQKTPRRGGMSARALSISDLAEDLGAFTGKTVLDQTGLKGKYDFTLYWSSEPILPMPSGDGLATSPADSGLPSIFTAVEEQLGLKLVPMKGPTEVLVIDHIEQPSEN
jgi:uncharacterized protein (TIGR03435 family)